MILADEKEMRLHMVTTSEELYALDVGAVIRDANQVIYEKGVRGGWLTPGSTVTFVPQLPVLVLWEEGTG